MPGFTVEVALLGAVAFLLLVATALMALIAGQLKAMRREAEETRALIAKMDWGVMLFNSVQQLKAAVDALDQIDKRLQKLEAIEKVHLSQVNARPGS